MKYLHELFAGAPQIGIEHLSQDSRDMKEHGMFFCVKGLHYDGHQYIQNAIDKGAVCIVHSDEIETKVPGIVYITVPDVLDALNIVADKYYDHVSSKMKVLGVTGTNGKSTVSYITYQLLNRLQLNCGYIGTISIEYNDVKIPSPYTTPEAIYLHRTLHDMYEQGVQAVSMEVSSNGLDLKRTNAVVFDVGVFTNLTHEHLDFHGTMEGYLEAKKKLFYALPPEAIAILNKDGSYYEEFAGACKCPIVTYSLFQDADLRADNIMMEPDSTTFVLYYKDNKFVVQTNLLATFNVSNLLASIASVMALGYPLETILEHVNDLGQVSGRIERIEEGQNFQVIVDYAHTPDGFYKIYEYAKAITPPTSKIITVFGSAGQRDTKKRPILGKISDEYCDIIILTEEDPRNESTRQIADEIRSGISSKRTVFIESREAAIQQAIALADKDDTVLILGKGDEDFLARDYGDEDYAGDHIVAKEALRELMEEGETL